MKRLLCLCFFFLEVCEGDEIRKSNLAVILPASSLGIWHVLFSGDAALCSTLAVCLHVCVVKEETGFLLPSQSEQ